MSADINNLFRSLNLCKLKKITSIDDLYRLPYFETMSLLGEVSLHSDGIKNTAGLLHEAQVNGKSKILEVGCGTGATTKALLRVGLDVTVVEPSLSSFQTMLNNCFKNSGKLPK